MFFLAQQPEVVHYLLAFVIFVLLVIWTAITLLMIKTLRKVSPGEALVRTGSGGTKVSFERAVVIPILHQFELVNIKINKLSYERKGDWALLFKCGKRAELVADLMLRINREPEDVKRAVQMLGSETLNDPLALKQHFSSMFNDSLETIASKFDLEEFAFKRDVFREELCKHIGSDLSGMVVDDICIHHLKEV